MRKAWEKHSNVALEILLGLSTSLLISLAVLKFYTKHPYPLLRWPSNQSPGLPDACTGSLVTFAAFQNHNPPTAFPPLSKIFQVLQIRVQSALPNLLFHSPDPVPSQYHRANHCFQILYSDIKSQ